MDNISSKHPQVDKGRVRENIINLLSQQPYSLTDLSRILKVSKPTISYHLTNLSKNGIIRVIGTKSGRGGFRSKLYILKENLDKNLPISSSDTHYLDLLSGIFESNKLEWEMEKKHNLGNKLQIFLYQSFRLLRNVTKTRHHDIFRNYGKRVGKEVIATKFDKNIKNNLNMLTDFFEENDIGNIKLQLGDEKYHPEYKFQCLGCFQARENGGPVCNFTKGIIEGFLEYNYGKRYEIGERRKEGTLYESCVFPMRRSKKRGRAEAINIE
jgi:predicted hydrocarbon binding protein|uniref:Predicted transcriptional regulator ArsR family n=1 Tax=uncultured marine crenarchaeote AD1000-325-A12 TaxID=526639 RepID=B3V5P1_9ARCH|nr:predicted transcriptional regulator ArsR family [uncultured marine crenarchaeote AD1000-325-A12]|tara:strand:- start:354 stop:1157 length:804 start_codon:yes stop_codon:yes gene_type:complete